MEFKGNEGLTELKVSYITEMINPVELVKDLTFDEVLTDADKMDMLMANGYNYKMMLEEKEEPHRKFMAIINADEADLLDVSLDAPEAVDLSVHYQMLKMLKEHYGATVEKAVLWGKEDQVPQTSVYMRKTDGTVVELTVKLADALVLATLGEAPFYIRTEMLENRVPDFAKKSVSHLQAALLRGLPMFYLEKEMEKAIREENYEYAELIKREMQARKERGETDDSLEEEANETE